MTKIEKELVEVIKAAMKRKKVTEGDPKEMFKITKRSNRDFIGEAKIGNHFYSAQGKELRDVVKNLIKEIG